MHESETRFRALFESAGDAILILEGDIFVDCNQKALELFKCERDDIIGYTPIKFSPEVQPDGGSSAEKAQEIILATVKGVSQLFEWVEKRLDGTLFDAEIRLSLIDLPTANYVQAIVRDITDRKRIVEELRLRTDELYCANNELRQHKEHLEDLVDERTGALNESVERLKKMQESLVQTEKMAALGELVAGVAHEINTPVGIGVTAASHLEDNTMKFAGIYDSGELTRDDFEKYINVATESSEIILSNMRRAADLIQSFKQVAIDQLSEELRDFNVKKYINEILTSLHSKFKNTGYEIVIVCMDDLNINSYPGVFSQILTNLLINSLIHGFEGVETGIIEIEVFERDGIINIIYQDSGCGISEDNIKRIFDPFYTTKRGLGGSGLGLHIIYNLVTQTLGGAISCSSVIGEGTRFDLSYPCVINT